LTGALFPPKGEEKQSKIEAERHREESNPPVKPPDTAPPSPLPRDRAG
jgi:hypothetical protein